MRILCLFPGQGSQQENFFGQFYGSSWDIAARNGAERLSDPNGYSVQKEIVVCSRWIWEQIAPILERHEITLSGHSLGELTATSVNLSWPAEETYALASFREELMKKCSAKIGGIEICALLGPIDRDELAKECHTAGPWLMNDNSAEQVVIGGMSGLTEKLTERKDCLGIRRVIRLPMNVLSHCSVLEGMQDTFGARIATISGLSRARFPQIFVRNGLTTQDKALLEHNLVAHLTECVRFRSMIEQCSFDLILEVGPSAVLSGLVKKISPIPCLSLNSPEKIASACNFIKEMETSYDILG